MADKACAFACLIAFSFLSLFRLKVLFRVKLRLKEKNNVDVDGQSSEYNEMTTMIKIKRFTIMETVFIYF